MTPVRLKRKRLDMRHRWRAFGRYAEYDRLDDQNQWHPPLDAVEITEIRVYVKK